MDLKLPSSAGQRPRWRLHRDFLAKALEGTASLTIKVVVNNTTTDADICEARNLVAEFAPDIPFVLQPMTAISGAKDVPEMADLQRWRELVRERLSDVRIIPQMHHFMGLR